MNKERPFFKRDVEKQEDVYVHSKPEYSVLYDLMWERQHKNQNTGIETWGRNRVGYLYELFDGQFKFPETSTVLDLCCGLGRITAASLELGAGKVVGADGSYKGLLNARQKMSALGIDPARYEHVQLDVEQMSDCFNDNAFDIVIHYYALQHIKDFRKTLSDIKAVLRPNGLVAFNYFTTGTTHHVTRLLRNVFLQHPPDLIFDFLEEIGYTKGSKNRFHHDDLLSLTKKFDSTKYPFIANLQSLAVEHGSELVGSKVHFEDFTTPYLHNFDHSVVYDYVQRDLGMRVINSSIGRILAQKV